MSHSGRDLNQSGDGLPRRFQMLSLYRARHRTRQLRLKFPLLLTIYSRGELIVDDMET